jgi:signal transduction histidine kinase
VRPRGIAGRILLAFAGLALAMTVAVSASLFVVLREMHRDATEASLRNQVTLIEAALVRRAAGVPVEQTARDLSSAIADDDGFVLLQRKNGVVVIVAGTPSSMEVPPAPTGTDRYATGTIRTSDGQDFVYVEPVAARTGGVVFVFAVPDRSTHQALVDLARAMALMALALLLIGAPLAWLLSRSLTGPMRRLANAAAALPAAQGEQQPLPLEGPREVRVLTERFNAMAGELASTHVEEAQLLANLRHDLRTPLTSIGGYAEAIADGTAAGPAAVAAARTIAEETQRLERLVGELGVVERLRQGPSALRPEALDAARLLAQAGARFEGRAAAAGVNLEVADEIHGDEATDFAADRLAVERILQNLIENALSAVSTGGHVWLRAAPLRLAGMPEGVGISVTDDGPGFPPGSSERVFERFYRADPSRSGAGSGLGLAIVRELARAHGGEAWAENVAPHGARVSVLLPFSPIVPGDGTAEPGGKATGD